MPVPERPITPDTIGRLAEEFVRVPLKEADRKAVADLLQALQGDMAALHAFDVGESEPAVVYDPTGADT